MSQENVTLVVGIAGAIVAFLVGFIAEPIKGYFVRRAEVFRLRRALYREFAYLYTRLRVFGKNGSNVAKAEFYELAGTLARFECYEYAQTKPVDFYEVREAPVFNRAYGYVKRWFSGGFDGPDKVNLNAVEDVSLFIEALLIDGLLDTKLFMASSEPTGQKILRARLARARSIAAKTLRNRLETPTPRNNHFRQSQLANVDPAKPYSRRGRCGNAPGGATRPLTASQPTPYTRTPRGARPSQPRQRAGLSLEAL